ncbi:MAG: hypothetical protein AVDCRST_MAG12-1792, partial [uncultured Rubrobacteraceae bacterium]
EVSCGPVGLRRGRRRGDDSSGDPPGGRGRGRGRREEVRRGQDLLEGRRETVLHPAQQGAQGPQYKAALRPPGPPEGRPRPLQRHDPTRLLLAQHEGTQRERVRAHQALRLPLSLLRGEHSLGQRPEGRARQHHAHVDGQQRPPQQYPERKAPRDWHRHLHRHLQWHAKRHHVHRRLRHPPL